MHASIKFIPLVTANYIVGPYIADNIIQPLRIPYELP